MMHLYRTALPLAQLQPMDPEDMSDELVYMYKAIMGQYLKERTQIPPGNLIEVRYEELDRCPMEVLERIYSELQLSGWQQAKDPVETYVKSLAGYKRNALRLDQGVIDRISTDWSFALDVWPYESPLPYDAA